MNIGNTELDVQVAKSQKIYSKLFLNIYDVGVHIFSNKFAWKCSKDALINYYNLHVSSNHLDVGVGTGYLIDNCSFPISTQPQRLGLMDLSQNCLDKTAQRLSRYNPKTYQHNILEPFEREVEKYDSIGINYVLHCVPGSFKEKGIVFSNLKPLLTDGGIMFGSTLLSEGVNRNLLSKLLMSIYNTKGIFNNDADSVVDLRSTLEIFFNHVELKIIGCVGLFSATDGKLVA